MNRSNPAHVRPGHPENHFVDLEALCGRLQHDCPRLADEEVFNWILTPCDPNTYRRRRSEAVVTIEKCCQRRFLQPVCSVECLPVRNFWSLSVGNQTQRKRVTSFFTLWNCVRTTFSHAALGCLTCAHPNIRECTGLEFGKSQKAVEKREKERKLVAKSYVVPQRPSLLRD